VHLVPSNRPTLGPGNQLAIKGGSLELVVDERAEALVSLLMPETPL
jgi:hypothetical protein